MANARTKKIPLFFDEENYRYLMNLEDHQIFQELNIRKLILKLIDEDHPAFKKYLNLIQSGQPYLTRVEPDNQLSEDTIQRLSELNELEDRVESTLNFETPNELIFSSLGVYLSTAKEVSDIGKVAQKSVEAALEKIIGLKSNDIFAAKSLINGKPAQLLIENVLSPSENNSSCKTFLTLNLNQCSDEEILEDLKKLLPHARKVLSKKDGVINKPIKGKVRSDVNNMVDYKIIELIDLKIWERVNKNEIYKSTIQQVLFPDNDRDFFNKTVMRLFNKVMQVNYRPTRKT